MDSVHYALGVWHYYSALVVVSMLVNRFYGKLVASALIFGAFQGEYTIESSNIRTILGPTRHGIKRGGLFSPSVSTFAT